MQPSCPGRVWNRIPVQARGRLIDLALARPELSPRELAVTFTDERAYFVSETSAYRLLRERGPITSPAFAVMKAADAFKDKTTAPNQLWQTDFTYLKVTGWDWFYLSAILDDFSRCIIAWKLPTAMRANDVTDTIEMALEASRLDGRPRANRPRLLSDNGASYIADARQDRALASDAQEPHPPQERLSAGNLKAQIGDFVSHDNHRRYHESLGNLTPAAVYSVHGQTILMKREAIKHRTFKPHRLQHARRAA